MLDQKTPKRPSVEGMFLRGAVLVVVEAHLKISLSRLAKLFSISLATMHKYLTENNLHPYKPQVVQAFTTSDKVKRKAFPGVTDEAMFHLEGAVNRQNWLHWSAGNSNWTIEKKCANTRAHRLGRDLERGDCGSLLFFKLGNWT